MPNTIEVPTDQYGRVTADQVLKLFSRMVNSGGVSAAKDFSDAFQNEHRTLQQGMVAVMLTTVVGLADNADQHRFDPRNEAAARLAVMIRDLLAADDRTFIRDGEVGLPLV